MDEIKNDLPEEDILDLEESFDSYEDDQEEAFDPNEFKTEKYDLKPVEELVDDTGKIIEKENLSTMDYIKAIATKMGYDVQDPKENCKHCYGRGHINYITPGSKDAPIPCKCIYKEKEASEKDNNIVFMNRATRRKMEKLSKKRAEHFRKVLTNKGQEELKKKVVEEDGTRSEETV